MQFRRAGLGMTALLAACTNNNIAVSATMVQQTFDSYDAGDEENDSATAGPTGETTAGGSGLTGSEGTVGTVGESTVGASGDSSGGTSGKTGEDSSGGSSSSSSGDPDTTTGEPPVPPKYVIAQTCFGADFYLTNLDGEWSYTQEFLAPVTAQFGVGVSNTHVYWYALDTNFISRYGLYTDVWEPFIAGPPAITNDIGWVEWVGGEKVCMAFTGRTEIHCHDGDEWRMIPMTVEAEYYASWDPETNELYIKTRKTKGFQVIDLDTDEVVRTFVGDMMDNELYRCTFDYSDGYVYQDAYPNPIRIDSQTGEVEILDVPQLGARGGGVHTTSGQVYYNSDVNAQQENPIQVWDPATKETTLLPYMPTYSMSKRLIFQAATGG